MENCFCIWNDLENLLYEILVTLHWANVSGFDSATIFKYNKILFHKKVPIKGLLKNEIISSIFP